MILAAGMGTRLGHLTEKIPKALIEVNKTPLIAHVINRLKDFGISDITGFDLLREMRLDNDVKDISIIMSSGMNYEQESKDEGADGFVLKPYMPDDLLELIKTSIMDK